ncbi:enoyl-CoA hydratase-related protein [Granulosicoccaceae sp. 1_MG-2023]|nr:enoyl-CoA hydratase-related protein [Granulosicoccaceae sp. 1_MG-2023]
MTENALVQMNREGNVMLLTMNRPERKNALNGEMYAALAAAIEQADQDAAVRAIVITGSGDAFSAGNDLADFEKTGEVAVSPGAAFVRTLLHAKTPLLAAVNGMAVGIGVTMLAHCDLVYVAESARLRLPFTALGVVPEAGSSMLLPAIVGHRRAAELLLLGEFFTAPEAVEMGLANAACADDQVLAQTLQAAAKLASLPAGAVSETRRMLKENFGAALEARVEEEFSVFARLLHSDDAAEARAAFREKRLPVFNQ